MFAPCLLILLLLRGAARAVPHRVISKNLGERSALLWWWLVPFVQNARVEIHVHGDQPHEKGTHAKQVVSEGSSLGFSASPLASSQMSTWWLPQRALTNYIFAVRVAGDDMCEQFEVQRRSICVGVLPIQSGTFDGVTRLRDWLWPRSHCKGVSGGGSLFEKHGNGRARQRHSQCFKFLLLDTCGFGNLPLLRN